MPAENNISIKHMFLNADPVVQLVMFLLFLASLITWLIIFEKTFSIYKVKREAKQFKNTVLSLTEDFKLDNFTGFNREIAQTGFQESQDAAGTESRADYRERVERSMRLLVAGRLEFISKRTLFLATVGASSPFIGLFGTVWGIMNSFIGISATGETTLAVVAPGIAEALFATAMGLVAAIPAVIAYNKITGSIKSISKDSLAGIGLLGNLLSRQHFNKIEK